VWLLLAQPGSCNNAMVEEAATFLAKFGFMDDSAIRERFQPLLLFFMCTYPVLTVTKTLDIPNVGGWRSIKPQPLKNRRHSCLVIIYIEEEIELIPQQRINTCPHASLFAQF
jgi:hypothetical protein